MTAPTQLSTLAASVPGGSECVQATSARSGVRAGVATICSGGGNGPAATTTSAEYKAEVDGIVARASGVHNDDSRQVVGNDRPAATPPCTACQSRDTYPCYGGMACESCGHVEESPRQVAALFVRADSIYKQLPGVDCWDADRDALRWPGGCPVVAHPPCRAWASLRHCAKPRAGEKELAIWAIGQVRQQGGILEHPRLSTLWQAAGLPEVGERDEAGGFTLIVDQFHWGHRARKSTRLYVCGIEPKDVPQMPIKLGEAPCTVGLWSGRDKANCRPSIKKHEYEATPVAFAQWLVDLARLCNPEPKATHLARHWNPPTAFCGAPGRLTDRLGSVSCPACEGGRP